MADDKLTRDERVRLEALNQAIASTMAMRADDPDDIVMRAARFVTWIEKGE